MNNPITTTAGLMHSRASFLRMRIARLLDEEKRLLVRGRAPQAVEVRREREEAERELARMVEVVETK